MAKSRHRRTRAGNIGRIGLAHGRAWRAMDWYVPFHDGQASIYHGHEDADDHSACGPKIFCCPKAAQILLQRYPDDVLCDAEWEFTSGQHLVSWLGPHGPQIFYFFYCNPHDRGSVRFSGIEAPAIRDVLLKRLPLDGYLETADRIHAKGR